jgi:serine/threonine protein kinase
MIDLVGQSLGQYEITGEIGQGGMASVYRANQKSVGREVALKVISRGMVRHAEYVDRFFREVEIIANLQHPHILPIYDFGEQDNLLYIVMGYLGGGTLEDRICAGPVSIEQAAQYVRQIASALEYAHGAGVIHRDIKPTNVLLDAQGNAYVMDFGLAKMVQSDSNLTATNVLGTPSYMAPEMLEPETVTASADIYALGIALFEMLAGKVPFTASNPLALMMQHAQAPVPDIYAIREDLPPGTQTILDTAMAKDPAKRYATPRAMADALDRLVLGGAAPEVDTTAALLFTDVDGNVIFVDSYFLKLTGRPASAIRSLVGQSAQEVLGVPRETIQHWIKETSKVGQMQPHTVDIADVRGTPLHIAVSGNATYDEKGKCIGVDFTLRYAAGKSGDAVRHLSTPSNVFDTQEKQQVDVYFSAQIDAIRVLLVRLGGNKLAQHLAEIINETSEANEWPVRMDNSQIYADLKELRLDVYRALLAKAVMYGSKVIGKQMVSKQVRAVEQQMGGGFEGLGESLGITEMLG